MVAYLRLCTAMLRHNKKFHKEEVADCSVRMFVGQVMGGGLTPTNPLLNTPLSGGGLYVASINVPQSLICEYAQFLLFYNYYSMATWQRNGQFA